jgi:AcrR family transcriptional regulator
VRTPRQARVANALAKGATITEAAASAGLHRATIYKWLKTKKQFQAALGDARGAYQIALRKELQDLSHTVFATLHALLTDPKRPSQCASAWPSHSWSAASSRTRNRITSRPRTCRLIGNRSGRRQKFDKGRPNVT